MGRRCGYDRMTEDQRQEIVRLYLDGLTMQQVADVVRRSKPTVSAVLRRAGATRRNGVPVDGNCYLPTPDEIRERAEQVQSRWSEHTKRIRAGNGGRVPWMPPTIASPETIIGRAGRACCS